MTIAGICLKECYTVIQYQFIWLDFTEIICYRYDIPTCNLIHFFWNNIFSKVDFYTEFKYQGQGIMDNLTFKHNNKNIIWIQKNRKRSKIKPTPTWNRKWNDFLKIVFFFIRELNLNMSKYSIQTKFRIKYFRVIHGTCKWVNFQSYRVSSIYVIISNCMELSWHTVLRCRYDFI